MIPRGSTLQQPIPVRYQASELRRNVVKDGYRLLLVDKDGVLVCEFRLTENALAQPEAFVAGLQEAIESVEEEEP